MLYFLANIVLYERVIYVPQTQGTIYTNGSANSDEDSDRKRDSPFVTKKFGDRRIRTPTKYLPDIPVPNISELPIEVRTYIDRMKKEDKLRELAQRSNETLFKCNTVFPFDFFPDTLIIDKTKINIINKVFFLSESVHSIMIRTIKDLQVDSNIFFAKLTIIPDVYMGQSTEISYLKKSEALMARRIIQGLMLCQREDVDISDLDAKEIRTKIETAGSALEVKFAE